MIKKILYLLDYTFGLTLWVTVPTILLFVILLIFLIGMFFILFFYSLYTKNGNHYPYNIILDHIIPLCAIMSPTIVALILNSDNNLWFQKFSYILVIHLCFLMPLMYFWSKHRNWDVTKSTSIRYQPIIYLNITISLIYPAVLGFYLSCLRIFRFGKTVDLTLFFTYDQFIICLVVLYLIILFGYSYIKKIAINLIIMINLLRTFLWNHFYDMIILCSLYLLKYKLYFKICEIFFKLSFLWITYIIHYPFIYRKNPRSYFRRVLHKIYINPKIIFFIWFFIVCIEILVCKANLYYSVCILILILLLKPIIYFLNTFNGPTNNWVELCCYSNFIHNKWVNAYYPQIFWRLFYDMRGNIKSDLIFTKEEEEQISEIIFKWEEKHQLNRKKFNYIFVRVCTKTNSKFYHRLRLVYLKWSFIN